MNEQADGALQQRQNGVSQGTAKRIMVVAVLVVVVLVGYMYINNQKHARADAAIQSVIDACGTFNRDLVAQKVVEAKQVFREMSFADATNYDTKLANRMHEFGCLY